MQVVASLLGLDRLFHKSRPRTEKPLSANFELVRVTTRLFPQLDLRSLLRLYD